MKAKELAELLLTHPDWDVGFEDLQGGGWGEQFWPEDLRSPPNKPFSTHPKNTWLIHPPYQGPDPEGD